MTQCWVEFRNLCKEASNLDSSVPIKPEIHSFQTMYGKGGGRCGKKGRGRQLVALIVEVA